MVQVSATDLVFFNLLLRMSVLLSISTLWPLSLFYPSNSFNTSNTHPHALFVAVPLNNTPNVSHYHIQSLSTFKSVLPSPFPNPCLLTLRTSPSDSVLTRYQLISPFPTLPFSCFTLPCLPTTTLPPLSPSPFLPYPTHFLLILLFLLPQLFTSILLNKNFVSHLCI